MLISVVVLEGWRRVASPRLLQSVARQPRSVARILLSISFCAPCLCDELPDLDTGPTAIETGELAAYRQTCDAFPMGTVV